MLKVKRWTIEILVLIVVLFCVPLAKANASDIVYQNISVVVNGTRVGFPDGQPFIDKISGRLYISLRTVSENLGASVSWQQETQTVAIEKEGVKILVPIGSTTVMVNGTGKKVDAPARLAGGRTMVPLRFVSETFGAQVGWNAATKTALITLAGTQPAASFEVPAGTPWELVEIRKRITDPELKFQSRYFGRTGRYQISYSVNKKFFLKIWSPEKEDLDDVKEILKVFFPSGHEKVYEYLLQTRKGKTASGNLDGRDFEVYSSGAGVVKIGDNKL